MPWKTATICQQSVQSVRSAALHGDADDRQGGVGGKSTCQMGCHACCAKDDAKAVGLCAFCKGCCLGGGAVCRKDMCLKGDVQRLQLGTGTLDHRPIAVRTHDHCHFTNHFPKPLFLNCPTRPTNKKGCGTPVPRPLFPVFLSAHFAQGCTMPLIAVNVTPFHATRHQQHH